MPIAQRRKLAWDVDDGEQESKSTCTDKWTKDNQGNTAFTT